MDKKYTSIRLEVTSKCNLKCTYCHNSNFINSTDDMNTEQIINLITNLKKTYEINKVLLTGGEPLVNKDIIKLVQLINDLGIKVDMVTNGILLTDDMMIRLDKAGLKRIRLSIDDISTKNINRDNINSKLILNKIKKIVEKIDIEVCVHTVVTSLNVNHLYELYEKVLESGAKRWRVFDIGYQGGMLDNKERFNLSSYYERLIFSSKKIIINYLENNYKEKLDIEINNIFKTSFLNMNLDDLKKIVYDAEYNTKMNLSPCNYVTNHQITIRSNGNATLCQYFRNPISFFKNSMLVKNVDVPIEEKLKLKDIEYCRECKYVLNCKSGCRSRALFFTNDIKNPDPTACVLHTLVCNEIIPILPKHVKKIYNMYINNNGKDPMYSINDLEKIMQQRGFDINE